MTEGVKTSLAGRDFDTRAALLKSGKAEFLEHGFEGASLRTICANAHVTTGAFYAHFKRKEDLFAALVEDDLADYLARYDSMMERLSAGVGNAQDTEIAFMDYLMDHRDLFKLLFDCSAGTRYEGFKDSLIERFEKSYQVFFDSWAVRPVEHDVVKLVVQMKFTQYMALLYSSHSRREVRRIMERMQEFTQGGFEALAGAKMQRPT